MNRHDLVRQLVLSEIADDYEEPEHIYTNVEQRAGACGILITRREVEECLMELAAQGLANAYELPVRGPVTQLGATFPLDKIGEYYFWITKEGLNYHSAFRRSEIWPFDDEGDLVAGWQPPQP